MSTFKPKVTDVAPRPAATTAKCGPCLKLGRDTQSKYRATCAFTYMRGEDETVDVCEEHLVELRKLIRLPGQFPDHFCGSIWKE